jgi:hypothetical protein
LPHFVGMPDNSGRFKRFATQASIHRPFISRRLY